jgi:hypothetical protein
MSKKQPQRDDSYSFVVTPNSALIRGKNINILISNDEPLLFCNDGTVITGPVSDSFRNAMRHEGEGGPSYEELGQVCPAPVPDARAKPLAPARKNAGNQPF